MPITLPTSPTVNQVLAANSESYTWDGAKWVSTSISPTQTIGVVETGEAVLADGTYGIGVGTISAPSLTVMSFNIPSAGVWRVFYTAQGYTGATSAGQVALYNSAGTVVPNSSVRMIYTTSGLQCAGTSQEVVITTTGAATYYMKAWAVVAGSNIMSGPNEGYTKVRWQRLDSPTKVIGAITTTSVSDWVNVGTITFGGTTTAPGKGTASIDRVMYRNTGYKNYELDYNYSQPTGGSAGSGSYLISLPTGLNFSSTYYTFNQDASPTTATHTAMIPGIAGYTMHHNTNYHSATIVPWDATRFRVYCIFGTVAASYQFLSSTYYPMNLNPGFGMKLNFTMIAA